MTHSSSAPSGCTAAGFRWCYGRNVTWKLSVASAMLSWLALLGCGEEDGAGRDDGGPAQCDSVENVLLCGAPLLIAHRGGGKLRPEETLPAFENAAALGADVLELDVHSTLDGEVVCIHDDTVDRTTDGSGAVHDHTFAELEKLDAGYHFSPDGGTTHPWRGKGLTVPKLGDVLDAHPTAWFSIEIKQTTPDIVDAVLTLIDAKGAAGRVVLVSFSDDVVLDIRQKRPDVLTGMALGEMLALNAVTDETEASYQPPTRIVQPPSNVVTADLVARANRLGLRLHAWTINERSEMEAQLDLGTHGIMTDDPALLAEVIAER